MSRNIRRVRRNVDSYLPPYLNGRRLNINSNFNPENEINIRRFPRNNQLRNSRFINPTLIQRVSGLENEIAEINVALAEHSNELNIHADRLAFYEGGFGRGYEGGFDRGYGREFGCEFGPERGLYRDIDRCLDYNYDIGCNRPFDLYNRFDRYKNPLVENRKRFLRKDCESDCSECSDCLPSKLCRVHTDCETDSDSDSSDCESTCKDTCKDTCNDTRNKKASDEEIIRLLKLISCSQKKTDCCEKKCEPENRCTTVKYLTNCNTNNTVCQTNCTQYSEECNCNECNSDKCNCAECAVEIQCPGCSDCNGNGSDFESETSDNCGCEECVQIITKTCQQIPYQSQNLIYDPQFTNSSGNAYNLHLNREPNGTCSQIFQTGQNSFVKQQVPCNPQMSIPQNSIPFNQTQLIQPYTQPYIQPCPPLPQFQAPNPPNYQPICPTYPAPLPCDPCNQDPCNQDPCNSNNQSCDPNSSSGGGTNTIDTVTGTICNYSDITIINQPTGINNSNAKLIFGTSVANTNIDSDGDSGVITDSGNNIIAAGYFTSISGSSIQPITNAITLYNSDNTVGQTLTTDNTVDSFLVKYNPNGFVQWVARVNSVSLLSKLSVAVDNTDNIIFTGSYDGASDIYNSGGQIVTTLAAPTNINSFIIKFDPQGNVLWVDTISASVYAVTNRIITDNSNNLFVVGYYSGLGMQFSNADGSIGGTLADSFGDSIFVAKYDTNGFVLWTTVITDTNNISGNYSDRGLGIAPTTDNSVVITGYFNSNPLLIYNAPNGSVLSNLTLTNSGTNTTDAFLIKFSSQGSAIAATTIGGTLNDIGMSTTSDQLGNVYVGGVFNSSTLIANNASGAISTLQITNNGSNDIFLVKYDINLNGLWITKVAGSANDVVNSISTDSINNVTLNTAYQSNPVTIYNSDGTIAANLTNNGGYDAAIIKFNTNGFYVLSARQAGPGDDVGADIKEDHVNNIVSVGSYNSFPVVLYNSDGTTTKTLANNGNTNIYVAKYGTYGQILTLTAPECNNKTKTIILQGYNGINTLINANTNLLQDANGHVINSILLTNPGATLTLYWSNGVWTITYSQGATLLYN